MRSRILVLLLIALTGCSTSRYSTAEKYLENEQYNNALRAYARILDPHLRGGKKFIFWNTQAVTGIGEVYWKMKSYDRAETVFRMVLDREPYHGKAAFLLGITLEAAGKAEEALKIYKRYPYFPVNDPYRRVLLARNDFLVRQKVIHEIRIALQNERTINIQTYPENSIGVLYFLSLSDDPQWQPLQKGIAEMLVTDLTQIEAFTVIERLRLQYLMDELRLGTTGLVEENTAPRLGKLLGARHLIKGSYMVMPDLRITMDAGVFESQNVTQPANINLEGDLSRLFRMEKELVLRVADIFQVELTPQQRVEILKIPTQNMMAFMSYCRGLDALDQNDFELAQRYFKEALKYDPQFDMARDNITPLSLWEAAHASNVIRVYAGVQQHIQQMPGGEEKLVIEPVSLVSRRGRLGQMGIYQDAGFIPGNESRKDFIEADARSLLVFPDLGVPPLPPAGQ